MQHDYDVAIIGAGMIGASLACALAPAGLRIAVIESSSLNDEQQPGYDDRGIALAPSSQRILEQINIWPQLQSNLTSVKKIHVSEQGCFGVTSLYASEIGRSELGHVVVASTLGKILRQKMRQFENIKFICPGELKQFYKTDSGMKLDIAHSDNTEILTMMTRLLVGADGNRSLVRHLAKIKTKEHDFKQTAIVCNITTQRPNEAVAYERFTPHGPIALLPIDKNRSVLVFTVSCDQSESSLLMSDQHYINTVQRELGRRFSKIERIGRRQSYPIVFIEAVVPYQEHLILLGNAAHSIHPNAAQGFNLGLRDVAGLTECLLAAMKKGFTPGDIRILKHYITLRRRDQQRIIRLTNGLAFSFYNQSFLLRPARNVAMILVDAIPPLKDAFAIMAMGLSGLQPRFVREPVNNHVI